MNASKVIITQETRARLNNEALSPAKKRQLREQMIIESIRKAVGGTRTKQELIAAAGYSPDAKSNSYAMGHTLVNSMIRRGLITHNNTRAFRKNWTVLSEVTVTPQPKAVAEAIVEKKKEAVELVVEEKPKVIVNKGTLLNLAKQFAWEKNSDSLREFIDYAQTRLK